MHGKQKYNAPLEIFKQFLKAINASLRSSAEFPNFCIKQKREKFSLHVATALIVGFLGQLAVELPVFHFTATFVHCLSGDVAGHLLRCAKRGGCE
jgi:hypothetical protein